MSEGRALGKEEIPMDPTILTDTETAIEESMEKIFELLEEKKYFMARDELLK